MLNKKAELTTNEIIELLLAAACVIIAAILFYSLISPTFNKQERTAEAYFNSFKEAVQTADRGGTGVFHIWQPEPRGSANYYLIYFKESISYKKDNLEFFSIGTNKNHICLCYSTTKENTCFSCENLKYPAVFGESEDQFKISQGQKVNIIKLNNENFYRFNIE